jgi:phospholipase/carboxylesterase
MDAVVVETGLNPMVSVIWLHGLGADAHDFEPIVPALVSAEWPPFRFVFPNAPIRPVTVNGGMRMRAWYDISRLDLDRSQDEAGVRASSELIERYIAAERHRGVSAGRVFLAGFSQGGAMALATGLTFKERLGGIVCLSGYVPVANVVDRERSEAARGSDIFLGHGMNDPVVPLELGQTSRLWLEERGYAVTWHTYPMAHSVSPEEIMDIRHWIGSRIS